MSDLAGGVEGEAAERLLSGVRGVGLLFAVPAVATTPFFPSTLVEVLAWGLTVTFAVGTLVIWLVSLRPLDSGQRARLTLAALLFDTTVVSGFVLVSPTRSPTSPGRC